jgi:Leucine-rich repeat (LRR) protein
LQIITIGALPGSSDAESANLFTGSIPSELCSLTDMSRIHMSNNRLTGTIPECIGSNLTNLTQFLVFSNTLQGTIPASFQELTLLEILHISDNHFHGAFPEDWIENLIHLEQLAFSQNNLVGTLPQSLSLLTNLEAIDGSWNNFTGPLPELGIYATLSKNNKLSLIDFSHNQLTGTVSVSFANLTALGKHFFGWSRLSNIRYKKIPFSQHCHLDSTFSFFVICVCVCVFLSL